MKTTLVEKAKLKIKALTGNFMHVVSKMKHYLFYLKLSDAKSIHLKKEITYCMNINRMKIDNILSFAKG